MRGDEGRREYPGPTCWEMRNQSCEYRDDQLRIPAQNRMTLHLAAYVKQMGFVEQALAFLPKQKLMPCNHALLRRRFSEHHTQ